MEGEEGEMELEGLVLKPVEMDPDPERAGAACMRETGEDGARRWLGGGERWNRACECWDRLEAGWEWDVDLELLLRRGEMGIISWSWLTSGCDSL